MSWEWTSDDLAGQEWAEADYLRRQAAQRKVAKEQHVVPTANGADTGVQSAEGVAGDAGGGAGGADGRDRPGHGRGATQVPAQSSVAPQEHWRSVMVCDGTFCYEDWELVDDTPEPPPFDDDSEPDFEFNWEGDDD